MMTDQTRVGLREAAALLGVHYMTIYRYVRIGRLPAERDVAKWSVAMSDLEGLREADTKPPKSRSSRQLRSKSLLERMSAGDETGAWMIVNDALVSGSSAPQIYTEMLIPSLRTIGDMWKQGRLSIAAEHRASAVATRIVGRLGPMFARRGLSRGTIVLGAPANDLHALPSAIVADLLKRQGFATLDLGANTPVRSFVDSAREANRLVAVLVGASVTDATPQLMDIANALRDDQIQAPIVFGGGAIRSESVARELGAEWWSGVDAATAISTVEGIAESSRHPKNK